MDEITPVQSNHDRHRPSSPSSSKNLAAHLPNLETIRDTATRVSTSIKDDLRSDESDLFYPSGISLLSLKNHLMLSYLHNLSQLIHLKLLPKYPSTSSQPEPSNKTETETPLQADPKAQELIWRLVRDRMTLEKMGPLEKKLKYQIDKLVRKAEEDEEKKKGAGKTNMQDEDDDVDEIINDPLSFRPNPSNFANGSVSGDSSDSDDESSDPDELRSGGRRQQPTTKDGIYRPPRIAAVPYPGDDKNSKKAGGKKTDGPSAAMLEMLESRGGGGKGVPYAETTTGMSAPARNFIENEEGGSNSAAARKAASKLERIRQYEEDNMTRLVTSKKEAKRRLRDEEFLAMGGDLGTVGTSGGSKRRVGGFANEFGDVLSRIGGDDEGGRNRKGGKAQKRGRGDGDSGVYDEMRKMKRKKGPGGGGGFEGESLGGRAEGGKKRGKFGNAVKQARRKK